MGAVCRYRERTALRGFLSSGLPERKDGSMPTYKKILIILSGILAILGCLTLSVSLLLSYTIPKILSVYLMANSISFNHDILTLDMKILYIFSAIKIILGMIGIFYFGLNVKDSDTSE